MTRGVRRRLVSLVAAAVGILAIALPANVSALDHHFSVVAEQTRGPVLKGNLGGGDHTLNAADGNGDFSGRIAGKAFVHHLGRRVNLIDFDLTR
jgi:hypothetical protein